MTTFNGAAFVKEQIRSVLSQLNADDELIIFDDLSTDETIKIIHSEFEDERINLKQNIKRVGVVRNFDQALHMASGDYIFLCDQDDVWIEGKVTQMVASLQNYILAVSDCKVVNGELSVLHDSFFALRHSGPGLIKNIYKNSYLGCCMAFRKELLTAILPIPRKAPMHDMWIGLIAETVGKACFIPTPTLLYRRHGKNASPTAENSAFNFYQQVLFRLVVSFLIAKRYLRNRIRTSK